MNGLTLLKEENIIIQASPTRMATWSTDNRPGSPAPGEWGFNVILGAREVYNGTTWVAF